MGQVTNAALHSAFIVRKCRTIFINCFINGVFIPIKIIRKIDLRVWIGKEGRKIKDDLSFFCEVEMIKILKANFCRKRFTELVVEISSE